MPSDFYNGEHYHSPTEYAAMKSVEDLRQKKFDEADKRMSKLIQSLKTTIDLAGFDLIARIEIQDRETGRIYR